MDTAITSNSPQRRRPRANGTFRLATHALHRKNETPEVEGHVIKTDDDLRSGDGSKLFTRTPVRSSLSYARYTTSVPAIDCSSSSNNNDNECESDDDVVFYKRDDDDVDSGNNREFDGCSASADDWCAALCSSDRLSLQSVTGADQAEPSSRSVRSNGRRQSTGFGGSASLRSPPRDSVSNQLSVEPIESRGACRASCENAAEARRASICCDLMVQYEMFDSVTKSQQQQQSSQRVHSRFARRRVSTGHKAQQQQPLPPLVTAAHGIFSRSHHHRDMDDDDDLMNIRSPVAQRATANANTTSKAIPCDRSAVEQQHEQQQDQEPREPQQLLTDDDAEHRGWSPEQLCQYNELLGFLQQACATRSTEISIPGARLAQMEQLLRSLQPPPTHTRA